MKLYQHYCKIVEQIKSVELAWFTTFNLDVELVERFLLSRLAEKTPQDLKTAEDFEGLNTELEGMDVKVWYDFRALNSKSPKLTTTGFYSVDPRDFHKSLSKDIVFHPKVIFLKGKGGAYLMAGSANLSIAAWSTNLESVLVKEITTRKNADEVLGFFSKLFGVSGINERELQSFKQWRNTLPDEESGWHFIENTNDATSLFRHLGEGNLTVWSPYFSRDISGLLERLKKAGYHSLALVPDISLSGGIRISPEEIIKLREMDFVRFLKSPQPAVVDNTADRLSHAKVWMTDKALAVGSWNCSYRATGLGMLNTEQNIEAGIVVPLADKTARAILSPLESLEPGQLQGTSIQELDAEWEQALNPYNIDCKIQADWGDFTYHLLSDCSHLKSYSVVLPDRPTEKIPLEEVEGRSFRENYRKVLKHKQYVVFNWEDKDEYSGFLIEMNTDKRLAFGYATLFDLFDSLLYNPLGATSRQKCQYDLSDEEDEAKDAGVSALQYRDQGSYYMMFVAFQKLYDSIDENAGKPRELDKIGFRLPGSLLHITGLVRESIEAPVEGANDDLTLYHYFLASELNVCIEKFNSLTGNDLPKVEVEHLLSRLNPTKEDRRFIKALKEEFGYGNV
jgi:hypothetical protein